MAKLARAVQPSQALRYPERNRSILWRLRGNLPLKTELVAYRRNPSTALRETATTTSAYPPDRAVAILAEKQASVFRHRHTNRSSPNVSGTANREKEEAPNETHEAKSR